jgi:hypothetical protein
MRLESTVRWRDVSGGNVQKVSSDITIPNSTPFSMNLLFDKVLGEAVSRNGTNIIGSQFSAGNPCLGLYQHIDTTFASSKLFAAFNGTIHDVVDGAVDLGSLSSTAKCRFTTFLNATLMLNGVTADKHSYTAADGWIATGGAFDLGNIPAGATTPIEFKDRVYVVVTDRVYYTAPVAGGTTLSWTTTGSGSLQNEQEDGGGTTQGLNKVPGYLMIYKQRSLKRWNFDSTFPEDLVNIGTQSNESIVRARGRNFFFYGPNGFYETDGKYPVLISRPVQRIVDGIASSFYENVNGWSDNYDVYWSVGDVTVDFDRGYTETYTNVVLRYNIDSQQWSTHRYAHRFRAMHQYISGTDVLKAVGDTDGQVLQLDTGTTDYNGAAITYILESPEFDFNRRELKKTVSEKIFVHSDGARGSELQARLDYGEWKAIGSLGDIVSEVWVKPLTAKVFQFRITDSITGAIIKLRGLDFPNVELQMNT